MKKKPFAQVLEQSGKILSEYDLCEHCLGRLFAKKMKVASNQNLGKKIHKKLKTKSTKCFVCRNIFDLVPEYVSKMKDSSADYDFESFLVGAKIKPSILDRDDQLRSHFRMRGMEGIKTNLTREISKKLSSRTKKRVSADPDLTFTIDFKKESIELQSKPVFLSGRYSKSERDLPQKQKPCDNCLGKGCAQCSLHGIAEFASVEGIMSKYYFEKFGALQAKITWIGGEDESSLVLGDGRPFFAKLIQPKKRKMRFPKNINLGGITLHNLRFITKVPTKPVRFVSKAKLLVRTEKPQEDLDALLSLKKNTVAIYEKSGKRSEKVIYDIRYRKETENSFYIWLKLDGGVPLKRLVSGENVFPNVSDLLENKSQLELFDFEQVMVKGV